MTPSKQIINLFNKDRYYELKLISYKHIWKIQPAPAGQHQLYRENTDMYNKI